MTKLNKTALFAVAAFITVGVAVPSAVYAATSTNKINLQQIITEGTLVVGTPTDPSNPNSPIGDNASITVKFDDKAASSVDQISTKEADQPIIIDNSTKAKSVSVALAADTANWADGTKTMGYNGTDGLLTGSLSPADKNGTAIAGTSLSGNFTFNGKSAGEAVPVGAAYTDAAYSKITLGKYTFNQTIPGGQAAGDYKLTLTQTVTVEE